VEAVGARVIVRAGAAEFLADLDRRLAVFAAHPSGQTPVAVNDELIVLLRRGDRVGLGELLRKERRELEERLTTLVGDRHNERPDETIAIACHDELLPVLERRLASLLPVALHADGLLADEFFALADCKSRQPVRGGYNFSPELLDWCAWWLGLTVGAFLVRQGRFPALAPLFEAQTPDRYGTSGSDPLVGSVPGEAGRTIGLAVMSRVDDRPYDAPAWEALHRELPELEVIRERYPELVSGENEPLRSLVWFDFLQNIALGLRDRRAVSHWTMYEPQAEELARRLHADARLREQAARAVGTTLADFDEKAPEALRAAHALGQFPDRDAITIAATGSRR
jgi:hypothetical protein